MSHHIPVLTLTAIFVLGGNAAGQEAAPEPERPFTVTHYDVALAPRRRTLAIRYHGTPRSGLLFVPEREQVYTIFSTSQWMIALDEPDARATLRLRLTIPRDWTAAGSGREVSRQAVAGNAQTIEWRQDRAVPTYTFGFVAATFTSVKAHRSGVTLQYLASGSVASDVDRIFGDAGRIIRFFTIAPVCRVRRRRTHRRSSIGPPGRRWPAWRCSRRSTAARCSRIRRRSGSWRTRPLTIERSSTRRAPTSCTSCASCSATAHSGRASGTTRRRISGNP